MGDIDREYESDYARYVLDPDPETLIELVDLKRKAEKENGPDCDCRAVDLPANHQGVCPICHQPKDENPRYGPGNPDWEHDRQREDERR